jgi:NAD(P)-dependent dehydrogenase (short-subunit alcohol dehydrogenase family)
LFDYDNDNDNDQDSVPGISVTTSVLIAPPQRDCGQSLVRGGGLAAFPALSFYNASKFAVEALSEALAQEVAPLGIKVLLVEPGPFRTDWAGRSAAQAKRSIPDYDATAGARMAMIRGYSGQRASFPPAPPTPSRRACVARASSTINSK